MTFQQTKQGFVLGMQFDESPLGNPHCGACCGPPYGPHAGTLPNGNKLRPRPASSNGRLPLAVVSAALLRWRSTRSINPKR